MLRSWNQPPPRFTSSARIRSENKPCHSAIPSTIMIRNVTIYQVSDATFPLPLQIFSADKAIRQIYLFGSRTMTHWPKVGGRGICDEPGVRWTAP